MASLDPSQVAELYPAMLRLARAFVRKRSDIPRGEDEYEGIAGLELAKASKDWPDGIQDAKAYISKRVLNAMQKEYEAFLARERGSYPVEPEDGRLSSTPEDSSTLPLDGIPHPEIATRLRAGKSINAIATELGISRRQVKRRMEQIKHYLQTEHGFDDDGEREGPSPITLPFSQEMQYEPKKEKAS